jgi:hypothetical protein
MKSAIAVHTVTVSAVDLATTSLEFQLKLAQTAINILFHLHCLGTVTKTSISQTNQISTTGPSIKNSNCKYPPSTGQRISWDWSIRLRSDSRE